MPSYVSDTHTLVWHLAGSPSLSPKVRQVLETADKGESSVFVPTIVVVEMVYLAERVKINPDILKRTFELLQDPKGSYRPVPWISRSLERLHPCPGHLSRIYRIGSSRRRPSSLGFLSSRWTAD